MSAPATPARHVWTPDAVRALIDRAPPGAPRYECIDGELLVTPSPFPPHQGVLRELTFVLYPYVAAHRLGHLYFAPADLSLGGDDVVQPDLFVVPPDQAPEPRGWRWVRLLLLAVEVVSGSSARHDRWTKRRFYQRHRVGEYWVVDPGARLVERWLPDDERPAILADALVWQPCADAPPLTVELPALFEQALGPLPADPPGLAP